MLLNVRLEEGLFLWALDLAEADHAGIALLGERALGVVDVRDAARHARGEVAARVTKDNDATASHVLAAVVAEALDDGERARVSHAEPLAGLAAKERLAGGRAVAGNVAHDDVVRGHKVVLPQLLVRRRDDDSPAREALAATVVRVAAHVDRHAGREREPEALSRRRVEVDRDRAVGEPRLAQLLGDERGEHRAECPVDVRQLVLEIDGLGKLRRVRRVRLDDRRRRLDELHVRRLLLELVVLLLHLAHALGRVQLARRLEQRREIESARLVGPASLPERRGVDLQHLTCGANQLAHRLHAQRGQHGAQLLGEQPEEVDDVLGLALELRAEHRVLGSDADGARILVAVAYCRKKTSQGEKNRQREETDKENRQRRDERTRRTRRTSESASWSGMMQPNAEKTMRTRR
mmetsp:Transcript_22327/g.69936  ORF Transcript_22327/g.69936 Transcript_22327/m.69936 type:complete len:407 (-) Transcript_22327:4711-5931(-)